MGYNVGKSLVEEDMVGLADTLMKKAEEKGVKLILPTDVVLADKFDNDANTAIASKSTCRLAQSRDSFQSIWELINDHNTFCINRG